MNAKKIIPNTDTASVEISDSNLLQPLYDIL